MSKELDRLVDKLNKHMKSDVIKKASDIGNCKRVRSGYLAFDFASDGGLPVNRITEFYGANSSTKSWFSYLFISLMQNYNYATGEVDTTKKKGGVYKPCALIDVEGTYTESWGKDTFGIDNEELIYVSPESLEQAVDITDALLRHPDTGLVVFDSLGHTGPDMEVAPSMEDQQMGVSARFWNKAVRKFTGAMNSNRTGNPTLIAVNQMYDKIGITFGSPEAIKSGNGLKFAKSMSIKFSAFSDQKGTDPKTGLERVIGKNIRIENKKNKVGTPYLKSEMYFSFVDSGRLKANDFDNEGFILKMAISMGIVVKAGAWLSYGTFKIQGFEAFAEELLSDLSLYEELEGEVLSKFK